MKKRIESLENFQSKINESYYANDNGVIVDKDVNVIYKLDITFGRDLISTIQVMYKEKMGKEQKFHFYVTQTSYDISKGKRKNITGSTIYSEYNIDEERLETLSENFKNQLRTKQSIV